MTSWEPGDPSDKSTRKLASRFRVFFTWIEDIPVAWRRGLMGFA